MGKSLQLTAIQTAALENALRQSNLTLNVAAAANRHIDYGCNNCNNSCDGSCAGSCSGGCSGSGTIG